MKVQQLLRPKSLVTAAYVAMLAAAPMLAVTPRAAEATTMRVCYCEHSCYYEYQRWCCDSGGGCGCTFFTNGC